ncbi:hypothetical protein EIP86_006964 [Pleurotus ostreatoroseus]|nr:hypothetical protein EIP86_006964 [Pleurotus ostreatoroseus]
MTAQGKPILYIPNRHATRPGEPRFTPADTPGGPHQQGALFPFPTPAGFTFPSRIKLIPLTPSPLSSIRVHTTETASITKLDEPDRLLFLKRSRNLWAKLAAYASHETQTNTWNVQPQVPLPDGNQQYESARSLFGWLVDHTSRGPVAVVNCEAAVQDETRYINTVGHQVPEPWRDRKGDEINRPPDGVFFPQYGRPNHKEHPNSKAGRHKAGFPDYTLHQHPGSISSSATFEVKFFLAVPDGDLADIFTMSIVEPGTGRFKWIWGEVRNFRTRWGMLTNGSLVSVFVKTGNQELTLSELRPWASEGVMEALAGMTFASVDEKLYSLDLTQTLCPLHDRDCDWFLGAGQIESAANHMGYIPGIHLPPLPPMPHNIAPAVMAGRNLDALQPHTGRGRSAANRAQNPATMQPQAGRGQPMVRGAHDVPQATVPRQGGPSANLNIGLPPPTGRDQHGAPPVQVAHDIARDRHHRVHAPLSEAAGHADIRSGQYATPSETNPNFPWHGGPQR